MPSELIRLPSEIISNEHKLAVIKNNVKYTLSYIDLSYLYTWYVNEFEKKLNQVFRHRKTTMFKWLIELCLLKFTFTKIGDNDSILEFIRNKLYDYILNNGIPFNVNNLEYLINDFIDNKFGAFTSTLQHYFMSNGLDIYSMDSFILPLEWVQEDTDILNTKKSHIEYFEENKYDIRVEVLVFKTNIENISKFRVEKLRNSLDIFVKYDNITRPEYE